MNANNSIIHFLLDKTRAYLDEPTTNAKYDNDFLLSNYITPAMVNVYSRINLNADNPILLTFDVTLVEDQPRYVLPPNVGEVYRVGEIDEDGFVTRDMRPRNQHNPAGPSWTIDGNTIHFRPYPGGGDAGETRTIFYIPNGDFYMHYSDNGAVLDSTKKIVTLDNALSDDADIGYLDKRARAYEGAVIRLYKESGSSLVEERVIRSYDHTNYKATVDTAFTNISNTSGLRYEIVPKGLTSMSQAISLAAAMDLGAGRNIQAKQMSYLTTQYKSAIKTVIDNHSNMQARTGKFFDGNTIDSKSRFIMR